MSPRYVITGCAASGTAWSATVMQELGSDCGHERVFTPVPEYRRKDGFEGESSWFAVPHLPLDIPTVLIVRNPLRVVRSISRMKFLSDPDYWSSAYLRDQFPEVYRAKDHLGRILRYVGLWDRDVEPDIILHVDRRPNVGKMFEQVTGRKPSANVRRAVHRIGQNTNTHNGHKSRIGWSDIRNHSDGYLVVDKAARWGYL